MDTDTVRDGDLVPPRDPSGLNCVGPRAANKGSFNACPFRYRRRCRACSGTRKTNELGEPVQMVPEQIFLFLDVAAVRPAGGVGLQPYRQ
jgi:hypothetical protein